MGLARFALVLSNLLCRQLASVDLDFAHARLPILRSRRRGTSLHQPPLARAKRAAAVCGGAPNDGRALAERDGGRAVRVAPVARRISGVDLRTQGCAERVFLAPGNLGLRAKRATGQSARADSAGFLCLVPSIFRARPDGQANARHPSAGSVAAGLVAAGSI